MRFHCNNLQIPHTFPYPIPSHTHSRTQSHPIGSDGDEFASCEGSRSYDGSGTGEGSRGGSGERAAQHANDLTRLGRAHQQLQHSHCDVVAAHRELQQQHARVVDEAAALRTELTQMQHARGNDAPQQGHADESEAQADEAEAAQVRDELSALRAQKEAAVCAEAQLLSHIAELEGRVGELETAGTAERERHAVEHAALSDELRQCAQRERELAVSGAGSAAAAAAERLCAMQHDRSELHETTCSLVRAHLRFSGFSLRARAHAASRTAQDPSSSSPPFASTSTSPCQA